ncbi:efflux RND transporter permease subunit [Vibrio sp. SS-MA-C1-2]|uniref:efflux RND transporter permease subunit n=1 Tax=Vibrio sp. SS-MA-C1-2 TaxID=2908646 RepID=UPI0021A4A905|nr:efflux RND transporter permease subunit [Vibrio sp. SS-MA-C1-2]
MSQTNRGIIGWFANNSVAANLLMWLLILGGIFSAFTINKEVFPSFELNFVRVSVAYPGAAPEEIEEGINIKIEEAIKEIQGIEEITSIASDGSGTVTVEVSDNYDPKDILDEIKLEVDAISTFPDSIESPSIIQVKPENMVLFVSVYGDLNPFQMKELTKKARDEITQLPGVSNAEIIGALDYEISIEVTEDKLREYQLTFTQVAQAVQRSSLDLPGGSIRANDGNIMLRTKAQAYNQQDFANIVVASRPDGGRVLLSQVATINDGFVDWKSYVRFNRQPAAMIQVSSVDDQNALDISTQVNQWVDSYRAALPIGAKMDVWMDLTFYLEGRMTMMQENMLYGSILVFLILGLFLNLKLAFWVMMGLPICFLGATMLMPYQPFSLSINLLSLFAFILVLGIVVDDAIVTGESVSYEIEQHGHTIENVVRGVHNIATPATFGVLTTIVAFIPMLLVSGSLGTISASIGWVVILCLIFSLVESKLILPAHLAHMKLAKSPRKMLSIALKSSLTLVSIDLFRLVIVAYYKGVLLNVIMFLQYLSVA